MAGWLEALLGSVFSSGVQIPLSKGLNFAANLRAKLNLSTKQIDVDVVPNTLTPELMAPEALNRSVPFTIHAQYNFTAAAADLALVTSSPFAFKILRVTVTCEQGNSAGLRLRSAASGGGSPRSGTATGSSPGQVVTGLVNVPINTVAVGASLYLHTDGAGAENGDVIVECVRV